jgi:hypothetical protein
MNISVEDIFMVIMAFLFGLFLRKEMACGLVEGNSAEVLERCGALDPDAAYQLPESEPSTVKEYHNTCDDNKCPTACEKIRTNFCKKKVTDFSTADDDEKSYIMYDTCKHVNLEHEYGNILTDFEKMCEPECWQFYMDHSKEVL